MKRFTIVLALLSLPFIAGCMHHGHYYNDHRPYASDGYYGPHRYDRKSLDFIASSTKASSNSWSF